jgi:hypothetical protein
MGLLVMSMLKRICCWFSKRSRRDADAEDDGSREVNLKEPHSFTDDDEELPKHHIPYPRW